MIFKALSIRFSPRRKARFLLAHTAFLLAGFTAVSASAAPEATSARKQIHAAVQTQAAGVIKDEAKRRNWPDYQAKMNVFIPSEVSQLAVCPAPLKISLPGGERIDLNRMRFDVRCDAGAGWDMAIAVKPDIYLPVVMAKKTLERGQVLGPSDITLKKFNISNSRGNYVTNPDEVMGLTVKRRVRETQPIALSQLESPVLVERGQRVMMIAEQDGVEARTMGEAMKRGRRGEVIKVKNESSQRVVSAIVTDSGMVRMTFAAGA